MPEKHWLQDFETGIDRLRVHFITEFGKVLAIIVIQYEAYIDGKWRPIVRFDEAHGFFHRDIMHPSGTQEKTAHSSSDKGLALPEAIEEIKENWQTYREEFEKSYYAEESE